MVKREEVIRNNEKENFEILATTNGKILKARQRNLKIVENDREKQELLEKIHLLSGHGKQKTMKYLLMKEFLWKGMNKQINGYVNGCIVCCKENKSTKEKILIPVDAKAPLDTIHVDMIGPFERTSNDNRYILTMIDNFTKVACITPLKTKNADDVLLAIKSKLCKMPKLPRKIVSDNGLEFHNTKTAAWANAVGITWKFTSPYHPEANGTIERFHRTFLSKLKKITQYGEKEWDIHSQTALTAYHISFSRAIGRAPYEFLRSKMNKYPFLKQDNNQLRNICPIPQNKLYSYQKLRKHYQNKYATNTKRQNKFQIGDKVYYYNKIKQVSKLGTKWEDNFKIIKAQTGSYIIENEHNKRRIVANEKFLRFKQRPCESWRDGVLASMPIGNTYKIK